MPFNTALSGVRAASKDLTVTGNNIANASTTGFKSSRAEFGNLYASSVLGSAANATGSGVRLQDVAQNFREGSISFTESNLDMAISGSGFFVLNRDGEQVYSRAGTFGLDQDGHIVNNAGARLQGYPADSAGNISGLRGDLRIETSNLSPRQTTLVQSVFNLDSSGAVLQREGKAFETTGNAIAVTQVGLQEATTTTLSGTNFTLPLANDFSTSPMTFDVELSASSGNNGLVSVTLDTSEGAPATVTTFNDLRTLAGVINSQLLSPPSPQSPIDVVATAIDDGGGNYRLEFTTLQEGEPSQIRTTNVSANSSQIGLSAATSTQGIPEVNNGYPTQSIDVTDPNGNSVTYTAAAGATAATTASELNSLAGVSATASSTMRITNAGYNNANGNLVIDLNGVSLGADSLQGLEQEINRLSRTTLPGMTAEYNSITGDLQVSSAVGDDLRVAISSTDVGDSVEIIGNEAAPAQVLEQGVNAASDAIVVGGSIQLVLDEGYSVSNANPPAIGLFGPLNNDNFESVVINEFNPNDQKTYNSATSMTVYDSLGNPHVMTQFFVRQKYDPADPTTSPNHWKVHVQIDGKNVGDPDTTLPSPGNTVPTMATYDIHFNQNGSLNHDRSDDILISNWTPLDSNGEVNGAMGPQNQLAGGSMVMPDPPTSSNFVIDLTGTTQYNDEFGEYKVDQNGYTTGRLSALNIDEEGVIFARFTNGESQALGQIVLAKFTNEQGLESMSDTMWSESFESGQPSIGTPGSSDLGAIQSGALEESNVDLSEQLVNLIIAQRNFQANAKTIETADQTTQTIINLR
jgi:flagellar hook protein FlgE